MLDKSAIESWKDGLEEERSSMRVKVLENLLWICDHPGADLEMLKGGGADSACAGP